MPFDKNLHGWDKKRMCNQNYKRDPNLGPCGLCDGIGGIVLSDKNNDIKIAKCKPIKTPKDLINDKLANIPPKHNLKFKNDNF